MTSLKWMVPLLSLVDEHYQPQVDLIERHLTWLAQFKPDGLLVMGTTGEFPNFSIAQRQQYLEAVLSVNPGLPIMVNIGACSLSETLALQSHAVSQPGVSQVLWMPPFYFPDTFINGLENMLAQILSQHSDEIGFYMYHYPKMSQVSISESLLSLPKVTGFKDTSGDFNRMKQLVEQFPNLQIFSGTDYQIDETCQAGCVGIISALANLFPGLTQKAVGGDIEAISQLKQLRGLFPQEAKMPAMKAYLNSLGFSGATKTVSTLPYRDLLPQENEALLKAISTVYSQELNTYAKTH
jgi:4-hydroxy-tetrahydrodipicolinate synthase